MLRSISYAIDQLIELIIVDGKTFLFRVSCKGGVFMKWKSGLVRKLCKAVFNGALL